MKLASLVFACFLTGISLVQAQNRPSQAPQATAAVDVNAVRTNQEAAAAQDPSIVKRVDEKSGKTFYVRKEVDAKTGEVSFVDVEYCNHSGKFVNVSPSEAAACSKSAAGKKAGCCSSKGAASMTSAKGSCCAGKAGASKASCAGKEEGASCVKKSGTAVEATQNNQ